MQTYKYYTSNQNLKVDFCFKLIANDSNKAKGEFIYLMRLYRINNLPTIFNLYVKHPNYPSGFLFL
ncbi:MAG: hypothetical protein B6I20_05405 [Bacteroidetes bacterium 4572_117]|nr:MAG: hypothetical protein B6I20_05405 [Bacteroidetes bacterium 4572_117]